MTITDSDAWIPTFSEQDVTLLAQLGLKSQNLDLSVETSLGKVTLRHNVHVTVSAVSIPALFFTFNFHFADINKRYKAQTGSGDFRTYWKMAKRFAKEKRDRKEPLFEITEVFN